MFSKISSPILHQRNYAELNTNRSSVITVKHAAMNCCYQQYELYRKRNSKEKLGFYLEINMWECNSGRGTKLQPEARRAESGGMFMGRGKRIPYPPDSVWGSVVSSPAASVEDSRKFEIWCNSRLQKSLQKCQIKYLSLLRTCCGIL